MEFENSKLLIFISVYVDVDQFRILHRDWAVFTTGTNEQIQNGTKTKTKQ